MTDAPSASLVRQTCGDEGFFHAGGSVYDRIALNHAVAAVINCNVAFKGLIDFVERADIPVVFEQYVRMAPSERLRLGLSRREAFARRFDAVRIFERAGIGSLLRASSS